MPDEEGDQGFKARYAPGRGIVVAICLAVPFWVTVALGIAIA